MPKEEFLHFYEFGYLTLVIGGPNVRTCALFLKS